MSNSLQNTHITSPYGLSGLKGGNSVGSNLTVNAFETPLDSKSFVTSQDSTFFTEDLSVLNNTSLSENFISNANEISLVSDMAKKNTEPVFTADILEETTTLNSNTLSGAMVGSVGSATLTNALPISLPAVGEGLAVVVSVLTPALTSTVFGGVAPLYSPLLGEGSDKTPYNVTNKPLDDSYNSEEVKEFTINQYGSWEPTNKTYTPAELRELLTPEDRELLERPSAGFPGVPLDWANIEEFPAVHNNSWDTGGLPFPDIDFSPLVTPIFEHQPQTYTFPDSAGGIRGLFIDERGV